LFAALKRETSTEIEAMDFRKALEERETDWQKSRRGQVERQRRECSRVEADLRFELKRERAMHINPGRRYKKLIVPAAHFEADVLAQHHLVQEASL
jgi:hypothetical protein